MSDKYYLGILDYLIIVFTLIISTAIGIKFKSIGKDTGKMREYFMAGKNMSMLPVIMSATATMISPLTTIGIPAEIYKYGIQLWSMSFGVAVGMILAAYVFVPIYYQSGVCTVYEYLEMRFDKTTRYAISTMFAIQMILWNSSVLYSPVLAINAVTDLPLEISILVFGAICSIYCAIGGLKAVLWTDVFQTFLMFVTAFMLLTAGIIYGGGWDNILDRSKEGGRLNILNFQEDFTTRYTFWNGFFQGLTYSVALYGANQTGVQRLLSLSKIGRAKSALLSSAPLVFLLCMFSCLHGIALYAVYFMCDPIMNKKETGLTKYDQIVPYFLISKFHSIPGLTGLSLAGIFSASLTTVSSVLNSLATITIIDFVHPIFQSLRRNENKSLLLAKGLSLAYGAICICVAFALTKAKSISQVGFLCNNTFEGPTLAIFTIGVLTRKGSGKSIVFGLLVGLSITLWIGFSSLFSGYIEKPLPLSTSMCAATFNLTHEYALLGISNLPSPNTTISSESEIFILNKISYFWVKPIGFVITLCSTCIAIFISGLKTEVVLSDLKYLSPVARFWTKDKTIDQHMENENNFKLQSLPSSERHRTSL
ncbi:putative sodium-dependent multivitamin transporter [Argiope bruennichi]|uniref:putative sodium-dependent multivitamin transporter n=1 Tax=Argiope bruennichi TaxID=94029 RepID=UPI002493FAD3|nr:putative sodium-dependent multivitamin transporter [Argiope bruennichi]